MHDETVRALCQMPAAFHERGNISMIDLLAESGYLDDWRGITEAMIEHHLRVFPQLVDDWLLHSCDQRCGGWYFVEPGRGLDSKEGWRVGYYPNSGPRPPETVFDDQYSACAFYIKREAEVLRGFQPLSFTKKIKRWWKFWQRRRTTTDPQP